MSEPQRTSSKNTKPRLGRVGTADSTTDIYDHAINLVDATAPKEGLSTVTRESESGSWRQLARNATQTSVKDQLARRKYAKWQQDRFDSKEGSISNDDNIGASEEAQTQPEQRKGRQVETEHAESAAVDFGHPPKSPEATKDDSKKKSKQHHKRKSKEKEESAIDILYENQRGSFFCGIPLYSHSSLLQFDPAPWVNKDYHASPVNITNAQVPDPSWQWEWKHWYVDMTNDVDEDGWQYSFAFFGKFSWHGTHPWFHSFVRRRRWLRKRVKTAQAAAGGKPLPSSMSAAHRLNTDYFTIHSKRDRSPSIVDGGPQTARADSYISYSSKLTGDEGPEEINDIASLLKALHIATIDRAKIDAVKQFVELGGEELAYLKERIPEIMQFLVFQNSKRQLLEFLRQTAREAQQHREEHDAEDRPEGEAESRRIDNLLSAVEAADEQIKGLEYWSDRKHVMVTTEHTKSLAENPLVTIFDKRNGDSQSAENDPAGGIRGIDAEKAEIGQGPVRKGVYRGATLATAEDSDSKGKGKLKEAPEDDENDPEDLASLSPRLKRDQVAISAEDEQEMEDATRDYSELTF